VRAGNAVGRNRLRRDENIDIMSPHVGETQDLELALLRRGVDERAAGSERCQRCNRTPLIGESIYFYEHGTMLCELCREGEREPPLSSGLMHGPAFGHTMRITDRRAA
jgi:hypothetical protein